jgi:hypothetical protein
MPVLSALLRKLMTQPLYLISRLAGDALKHLT